LLRRRQAGEVDPWITVPASPRVADEPGASMALVGEGDLEKVLGDLADVVRHAAREHHEALETAMAPVAVRS
jgi:hypothetical protein